MIRQVMFLTQPQVPHHLVSGQRELYLIPDEALAFFIDVNDVVFVGQL